MQDTTGIDSSARETLLLLADFSMTINGVFNDASNESFDVFKTVSSTSVVRTVTWTLSAQILANECNLTDFQFNRAQGGEATYTVPAILADGAVPTWTT